MKCIDWYGIHETWVVDNVADNIPVDKWERARSMSMQVNLHRGEVLYDIGTEHGALSAFYARHIVGGDAMVLVEPTPEMWRNIASTWAANDLNAPAAMVHAFAGAQIDGMPVIRTGAWPTPAHFGVGETPAMPYASATDPGGIPTVTIDWLVQHEVPPPAALTIDVEGAELGVLLGAYDTLRAYRPLVWCSIHDEMAAADFGVDRGEVRTFMRSMGYDERHLGTDHEQHWLFYDAAKPVVL